MPTDATAIRTPRLPGAAHYWTGEYLGPWFRALCGSSLNNPEILPWSSTAPEDRCKRCDKAMGE